jgi:mediator of RNA polymerase II transcription subunit 14
MLELASSELLPASTIFIPLPTSDLHYLIVRITTNGLIFELLRIARVPVQNGPGMKLAVDSRSPLPLKTLRQRRKDAKGKRKADVVESEKARAAVLPIIEEPEAFG